MSDRAKSSIRVRVGAVLIEGDKILLVQHRKDGREYWLLPGGGVEAGETLHAALRRELSEETGFDIAPGALRFTCESISPDGSRHIVHFGFSATRVGGDGIPTEDDPRIVGLAWHPLAALSALPLFPAFGEELFALLAAPGAAPRHLGSRWV